MMKPLATALAVLVCLAGIVGLGWYVRALDARQVQWEARVAAAETLVTEFRAAATAAAATAEEAERRAAAAAATVDTVLIERIVTARAEPVPDTCRAIVAERDALLDNAVAQRDSALSAYELQKEASAALRVAYERAQAGVDTLQAVLDARPRPRSTLIPQLGVGPFAGVCADGRACYGVGVALVWRF